MEVEEIWRDIDGWEDYYMISNTGKVYSKKKNLIKKTSHNKDGYESVGLYKDGERFGAFVHRLVAKAFVPNPDSLPIVNHKDENPMNNHANNLEWCTYSYNNTYKDIHIKRAKKTGNTVYQYDSNGDLIEEHYSCRSAAKFIGTKADSNICSCCNGESLTAYGYVFSYQKLDKEEVLYRFKKSELLKLRKNNEKLSKSVNQYDLAMNLIATYPSTQEAGRKLGFSSSLIASVCRGEHSYTHGFIFKYV